MLLLTVMVQDSYVTAITREGFDWNPIGMLGSVIASG
jgi:hypothetical protein